MGSTGKQRKCKECGQPFMAQPVEPEYDAYAMDRHDAAGTEPKPRYAVLCIACAYKPITFEELVGLPPKQ